VGFIKDLSSGCSVTLTGCASRLRGPGSPGQFPVLIAASPYPRQIQDLGAPLGFLEAGAATIDLYTAAMHHGLMSSSFATTSWRCPAGGHPPGGPENVRPCSSSREVPAVCSGQGGHAAAAHSEADVSFA
jgi:hypothetical protein